MHTILPEDRIPMDATNCERCELSKYKKRVVWGEGNSEAPFFILLDNPDLKEDRFGQPFLCGTRETLLEALQSAGIGREDVYVSYLLKCRPARAYERVTAWNACMVWLNRQIHQKSCKIIIGLGNNVARALLHDGEAEDKSLRNKPLTYEGFPLRISYHPLAARRRPQLLLLLEEDLVKCLEYANSIT